MKTTSNRVLSVAAAVVLGAIAATAAFNSGNARRAVADDGAVKDAASQPRIRFTDDGRLLQPTGYRKWIYVGTPLTPHDMNDGKAAFPEFHSVYINPSAYDQYKQTGEFPDGTVPDQRTQQRGIEGGHQRLQYRALKIHFIKDDDKALSASGQQYVATLCHKWLENFAPSSLVPSHDLCLSLDLFRRNVVHSPKAVTRRMNDIEAACAEIAALWPVV